MGALGCRGHRAQAGKGSPCPGHCRACTCVCECRPPRPWVCPRAPTRPPTSGPRRPPPSAGTWAPCGRDTAGPAQVWLSLTLGLPPEGHVPSCWPSSARLLRRGRGHRASRCDVGAFSQAPPRRPWQTTSMFTEALTRGSSSSARCAKVPHGQGNGSPRLTAGHSFPPRPGSSWGSRPRQFFLSPVGTPPAHEPPGVQGTPSRDPPGALSPAPAWPAGQRGREGAACGASVEDQGQGRGHGQVRAGPAVCSPCPPRSPRAHCVGTMAS